MEREKINDMEPFFKRKDRIISEEVDPNGNTILVVNTQREEGEYE